MKAGMQFLWHATTVPTHRALGLTGSVPRESPAVR